MNTLEANRELHAWSAMNPNASTADRVRVMRAIFDCIDHQPVKRDVVTPLSIDEYLTELRIGGAL